MKSKKEKLFVLKAIKNLSLFQKNSQLLENESLSNYILRELKLRFYKKHSTIFYLSTKSH